MIDTEFFHQLDRFSFMIRKRVSNVYAGSRRSIRQGKGIEVVGYREYMPGDDFKSIDWRLYGRTEKLYIRKFEEEKNVTTHILLDTSKSMEYKNKFDYAARLAVGFAYLVTKENEKFSISTFSDKIDIMQPRRGRGHLSYAIDTLNNPTLKGITKFGECIEQYNQTIKSRSLVVIISDFLDSIESIKSGIYRIAHNDLIVIHVYDKTEYDLNFEGEIKLHDLETKEVIKTYLSPKFKSEYKEKLNKHIEAIRETCNHIGANFFSVSTDTPIFDVFFEVINTKGA
ncbi:MAG: DUF58 domain-containing protein [Methanosarcinales archaeon]